MRLLDSLLFSRTSFHRQLFLIFAIGVTVLAVVASLTTAWVTGRQVRALLITDGIQVTGNLANHSVLALLYDSGENAADAARTTLSFPAIRHVSIFNRDRQAILDQGETDARPLAIDEIEWVKDTPQLIGERRNTWHFIAPVYTHESTEKNEDPLYQLAAVERELLGHVYVIMHKNTLRNIQVATIFNNMAIALIIAAVLMLILHASLTHLTQPLNALSSLMERAERGETNVYAKLLGPKEVIQIASAFNTMMGSLAERDRRLREQNLRLETEVSLRTRELVQARDAAVEANRHKSEFLANVSHELRTPLQSIIGYTDVLTETLEEDAMDEYVSDLERILHNAQHLLSLINSILALAKIESGAMELKIEPVEIRQIVAQSEETIRPLMKINHNRLEIHLESCEGTLEIDGGKVLQILLNLLSNAAKFTQDGDIKLYVRRSAHELLISVADTGVGISKEQQSIVFDPFRQADGSTTRHFQGTGLGLSITQRFCQLMNGNITLDSEPGRGATFTVSIPLPVASASGTPKPSEPANLAVDEPPRDATRIDTDLI